MPFSVTKPSSCSAYIAYPPTKPCPLWLCSSVTCLRKPSLTTLGTSSSPRLGQGLSGPQCRPLAHVATLCVSVPPKTEHSRAGSVYNCSRDFTDTLLCVRPAGNWWHKTRQTKSPPLRNLQPSGGTDLEVIDISSLGNAFEGWPKSTEELEEGESFSS